MSDDAQQWTEFGDAGLEVAAPTGGGGIDVRVDEGPVDEAAGELTRIPEVLPVLPLKNTVLFPFLLSPLLVNTPRSQQLIDEVLLQDERLMVCTAVRHETDGSPGPNDVYRTGTLLRVVKMLKFPDDSYRLLVQGVTRVEIDHFTSEDPFLRAHVVKRDDHGDEDSVEMQALTRNVMQGFLELERRRAATIERRRSRLLASNLEDPVAPGRPRRVEHRLRRRGQAGACSSRATSPSGSRLVHAQLTKQAAGARHRERDQGEGPVRDGPDPARVHAAPAARGHPPGAR